MILELWKKLEGNWAPLSAGDVIAGAVFFVLTSIFNLGEWKGSVDESHATFERGIQDIKGSITRMDERLTSDVSRLTSDVSRLTNDVSYIRGHLDKQMPESQTDINSGADSAPAHTPTNAESYASASTQPVQQQ